MAWELEPESGAAAFALVEADVALHQLDQALADGKPEAGAAFLARRGGIGLVEAAKDARAERLRNAGALVVHADAQLAGGLLGADLHDLAFRRELGGVGKQVGHDLEQALAVGIDLARREFAPW